MQNIKESIQLELKRLRNIVVNQSSSRTKLKTKSMFEESIQNVNQNINATER